MRDRIFRFGRDSTGATAIEYSLIAGALALVIVAGFGSIAEALSAKLEFISGFMR